MVLFPSVLDMVNLAVNQILGFVLWLLVMPLRLLVGFFDPIFSPVTALFDFSGFVGVLGDVRSFFNAANYFVPLYAIVSIMQATIGVAFVLYLVNGFHLSTISRFGSFAMMSARIAFDHVVDTAKSILSKLVQFFFGG